MNIKNGKTLFKDLNTYLTLRWILFHHYLIPKYTLKAILSNSKGQGLFQIAENCGILKYRLQEQNLPYETVVPSVVKKGATGKETQTKI